ncbi:cytochrome P450 [Xylogone sp. PMI_703]|nr:cytochrome P450 [Xylogone sp. PMI_703]
MPQLTLLLGILALVVFALYRLYRSYVDAHLWDHIPTHTFEDGKYSREHYKAGLKELLEAGHAKYSKYGKPFKVPIPVGGYTVKYRVVLPKDHLEEMKHLSNNTFSWALASAVIFAQRYTGAPPRGAWSGKAMRIGIHQNLGNITQRLDQQIDQYFAKQLPQGPSSTGSINFMAFFVPCIATFNNSILVDEGLSSNPEWVRETVNFAINRYKSADEVRNYPPYIAALISPHIQSVKELKASRKYVKEQIRPFFEDLKSRYLLGEKKEEYRKGKFGYQWLWGGTPDDVTLEDFSDTLMRDLIASIHTTAKTISVAMVDLLSQPEYIDELRQEAREAVQPDGTIAIDKLFKIDCFLKESQRLTPVLLITMNRIVTKPYTFKVSGIHMPVGTLTVAATGAIATDSETFGDDAKVFDGRRFERLRLKNKAGESALKMGMATDDSLGFGYGSQACPGRFLAVNQMKLLMAKLLIGWNMTLEKRGQTYTEGRPKFEYNDFSVVAPYEFGVRLRKHEK